MAAEENNNEMAMEDILSSIKGILEEDEQGKSAATAAEAPVSDDVVADVLNSSGDIDDILELSPAMRVKDVSSEADSLPLSLSEAISDDTATETSTSADDTTNVLDIGVEATDTDSFFGGEIMHSSEDTAELPDYVAETIDNEETVSPFSQADDELSALSTTEEVPSTAEEYTSSQDYSYNDQEIEPEITEESIVEQSTDGGSELAVDTSEAAVDASANIISNFAKMFSREEEKVSALPEDVAPVISAGRVDKTLEDLVVESITRAIGNEISRQWNNGVDFKEFAEKAVVEETKKWLNNNLPQMVEKIVKQEIERVMAKVGSR